MAYGNQGGGDFAAYLQYLQGQQQLERDPLQLQGAMGQIGQAMQSNQAVMAQRNNQAAQNAANQGMGYMQQQGQNARLDSVLPLLGQLMGGGSGGFGGFKTNYGASVTPGGDDDYNSIVQQNAANKSLYGGAGSGAAPTIQPTGPAQGVGFQPQSAGGTAASAQQSFKPTYADGSTDYTQMTPYRNPNGNYQAPGGGYLAKNIMRGYNPAGQGVTRSQVAAAQPGYGQTTSRFAANARMS